MSKPSENKTAVASINPFGLRLQPDLKDRLEVAAEKSGRSLNAEIAMRLEASFGASGSAEGDGATLLAKVLANARAHAAKGKGAEKAALISVLDALDGALAAATRR